MLPTNRHISASSLCWWFQHQNHVLSKSLANLDFTDSTALPEGKELLLSTQKLRSVRSQTQTGFSTAGLDCSKTLLWAAGANDSFSLQNSRDRRGLHLLCVHLHFAIAYSLLCLGSNISGRWSKWTHNWYNFRNRSNFQPLEILPWEINSIGSKGTLFKGLIQKWKYHWKVLYFKPNTFLFLALKTL